MVQFLLKNYDSQDIYKYAIRLFPSEIVKLLAFINLYLIEETFEDPFFTLSGICSFYLLKNVSSSCFTATNPTRCNIGSSKGSSIR